MVDCTTAALTTLRTYLLTLKHMRVWRTMLLPFSVTFLQVRLDLKWSLLYCSLCTLHWFLSKSHTYTYNHFTAHFVWDNLGEVVPEETSTHSHPSWSPIIPYLLHPSSTIHGILPVQFPCLTVFFQNLCPSLLWSTSWPGTIHFIFHTLLHPVIDIFLQHMPTPLKPVLL